MMEETIKKIQEAIEDLPAIRTNIEWIKKHLEDNGFVKRTEFKPVKRLVYGAVSIILTSFIIAVVALVIVPVI